MQANAALPAAAGGKDGESGGEAASHQQSFPFVQKHEMGNEQCAVALTHCTSWVSSQENRVLLYVPITVLMLSQKGGGSTGIHAVIHSRWSPRMMETTLTMVTGPLMHHCDGAWYFIYYFLFYGTQVVECFGDKAFIKYMYV